MFDKFSSELISTNNSSSEPIIDSNFQTPSYYENSTEADTVCSSAGDILYRPIRKVQDSYRVNINIKKIDDFIIRRNINKILYK